MQNKKLKAGTKAEQRTTAESGTSASLEQNGLLSDAVQEGNRLIAFSMGGKIISTEPYEMPHGSHSTGIIERWQLPKNIPFDDSCTLGHFKFHSNWEHLMAVIDEIEEMGFNVNVKRDVEHDLCYCIIFGPYEQPPYINISGDEVTPEEKKKVAFKAVVEFFKWYNAQNNKSA